MKANKTKSVKFNNERVNIILVDFSPHLLRFLRKEMHNNDLCYQLFYKVIKHFETACLQMFQGKFLGFLVDIVVSFLRENLLTLKPSELAITGDASSVDKKVYVNMVLINMLLAKQHNDEVMKIKQT